jgi:prepilin-type processing-associated H-X9-DG protein
MWSDLTRSESLSFYASNGSNHVFGKERVVGAVRLTPLSGKGGANVVYNDGHLEWRKQDQLRCRFSAAFGGITYYGYW